MVSILKWMDASSEEDLQEIHAGHPVTDKLEYTLDQHINMRLSSGTTFKEDGLLTRSMKKEGVQSTALASSSLGSRTR